MAAQVFGRQLANVNDMDLKELVKPLLSMAKQHSPFFALTGDSIARARQRLIEWLYGYIPRYLIQQAKTATAALLASLLYHILCL